MRAALGKVVKMCKCPHCDRECANEIRPYVCVCGAVFGKNGWITTVTVKRTHGTSIKDHHAKRIAEGRRAWKKLHSIIHGTPELLGKWKKYIPPGCECRKKVEAILKYLPPCYDSPEAWFKWTVDFHNEVNVALGKPAISMDRAYMLWRGVMPSSSGRRRAVITVANGMEFCEVLAVTRPYMQAYADLVDADFIDLDNDTEEWGPMEKFRVHDFASLYDEILFVDADCIITEKCPNLFEQFVGDVVIHDDYGLLRSLSIINEERSRVAVRSKTEIPVVEAAFNTGVVLTRKNAVDIWRRPTTDIGTSRFAEQVWIEGRINQMEIDVRRLPHEANWQYWYGKHSKPAISFEDGIRDAWIVHAAASVQKSALLKKVASHLSVGVPQPRIGLTVVTSMSLLPHHLSVQRRCLKSWLDMGLRVVSGNAYWEIDQLRSIYPEVEFFECKQSEAYDRPTSRVYDLMRLVPGPILLMNSDIELHGSQSLLRSAVESGECLVGLRHNYELSIFEANLEQWGIDAFLLHPEVIPTFPELELAIGQTMWDWWIPIHLESINARMRWVGDPFFFHKTHPLHWKKESLETGRAMISELYGVENSFHGWQTWRKNRLYGPGNINAKP